LDYRTLDFEQLEIFKYNLSQDYLWEKEGKKNILKKVM